MNTAPPAVQELARRLLMIEAVHGGPPASPGDESVRVVEKLRVTLTKLMGTAGFQALLSRALSLAKAELPPLGELRVREDGSLEGFDVFERNQDAEAVRNGGVILVGQFLGLLVTFIGKPLTMRLLHDTWPTDSMDGMEKKDREEKI